MCTMLSAFARTMRRRRCYTTHTSASSTQIQLQNLVIANLCSNVFATIYKHDMLFLDKHRAVADAWRGKHFILYNRAESTLHIQIIHIHTKHGIVHIRCTTEQNKIAIFIANHRITAKRWYMK
uniref:Uncharacterized protein n=1 Tax=Lygus hesperus TaxID=30085 RepID=A0A146LQV6_LYGHE